MQIHMFERYLASPIQAQHNHPRYPRKQNIACRLHDGIRIILGQFASIQIIGSDIRPLAATEPSIKRILLAAIRCTIYNDFFLIDFGAVAPIVQIGLGLKHWNRNAPRYLAADIPIFDIFEVLNDNIAFIFRGKRHFLALNCRDSVIGQLAHFDKPLLFGERLDDRTAFVAMSNLMFDVFFAAQQFVYFERR